MILLFLAQSTTNAADQIEDIRPLLTGDNSLQVVIWLAILLLMAVAAYLLWPNPKAQPKQPPLPKQTAMERLAALRERISTTPGYNLAVEISDILRIFVEHHFGIRTIRRTSVEFLADLARTARFDQPQRESLRHFVKTWDAIKFAGATTQTDEIQRLFQEAWTFVEGTK
jgi:hypothetical protein